MLANSNDIVPISDDANVCCSNLKKMHCFRKLLVLVIVGVCLGVAVYFTINSFVVHGQNDSANVNYTTEEEDTTSNFQEGEEEFSIITEWGGCSPKNSLTDLQLPVPSVIISHTGGGNCSTQEECIYKIQYIQLSHIESGYDDIGYNFLVGGDGSAYIGRGWDKEGNHSGSFNPKSIGISFIGTFSEIIPPQRQIDAAQNLIEQGLRLQKLDFRYILYGHRQVSATLSPGDKLYAIIMKWYHWSSIVI